jgi:ADP-ribose pyrophosphatase YjhB (NUDIX family)
LTRFGFIGPSEKHDLPAGGFCISVFALVMREDAVLALKPKYDPRWVQDWTPSWRIYEPAQLKKELASWRLPSTYVKEGEGPRDALDRVMVDQLGIKSYAADSLPLENFYEESRRYPGEMHWDYCFIFQVSTKDDVKEQPWLAETRYLNPSELKGGFGSGQDALLSRLGLT